VNADPPSHPAEAPAVVLTDEHAGVVDVDRLVALAELVLAAEAVPAAMEVGLLLVDPDRIATLKAEHLDGDGAPTDVLAFPIDDVAEGAGLLGDVVLCPAVASAQAAEHRASRPGHDGSPDHELDLLLVHGLLHLLGHDHAEPEETAAMQSREAALLGPWWASR
jgi:probable rRNA maturation factor